jgi:hypothetical protein
VTAHFRRDRRRRVSATFDPVEAALLRDLTGQLVELVEEGVPTQTEDPFAAALGIGPGVAPEDPVLARLLPDAYTAPGTAPDPEQVRDGSEFRRYTEVTLRRVKGDRARTVRDELAGDPREPVDVRLDEAAALGWLTVLTDLRLALATRIGLATEADAEALDELAHGAMSAPDSADPADVDPRVGVHQVYVWLGYLQESLVRAMP